MSVNKRNMGHDLAKADPHAVIGSDLAKVDAHVIQPEEYDEAPELTAEMLDRADWYRGDKLVRRGRPPGPVPKRTVTIRLDADVIAHFKRAGRGWQTRVNAALRKAARLKSVMR